MKRIKRFLLIVLGVLIVAYLLGPKPPKPVLSKDLPGIQGSISSLESIIQKHEALVPVRPDNEARIIWANDSLHERTDYCLLYLHGFSASYFEGYPTNVEFAKRYGCNAYFPRLASHGLITENALIDMTPDRLWEDSKEALLVARTLGKKVIIMSTSTGGTLALQLAADFPEYVEGLILYSPNIRINNGAAFLLSKPWGLQIARKVYKSKYRVTNENFESKDCQYWYCKYRLEAVVYLQQLVDATMKPETYKKVTAPVFLGYYYKDSENQDQVVKVDAMLDMFDKLGTPSDKKIKQAFPNAGQHVIACELTSGQLGDVKKATFDFAENVLNLKPVSTQ
jgi:alpha-beta hydrolase superfamily lysophospholipase